VFTQPRPNPVITSTVAPRNAWAEPECIAETVDQWILSATRMK